MRKLSVLVLPAILLTGYLMFEPHLRSAPDAPQSPLSAQALPRQVPPHRISENLTVEVDGIRLGMSRTEVSKEIQPRDPKDGGPRIRYDDRDRVTAVIDGKQLKVVGGETVKSGQLKETCLEALGNPKSEVPGVAGCGLDATTGWLFVVRGGGLRVYFYRDAHNQLEIAPENRSKLVSFELSDTLNGGFQGPL